MSAHDDVHNFLREAHCVSQEGQFIIDSLPNAEQPAVERVLHQLSAIRTILATLDDPYTDTNSISAMETYVTRLIDPLEHFLADPPLPAHTHIPLNTTEHFCSTTSEIHGETLPLLWGWLVKRLSLYTCSINGYTP
ncbi:hypothetical protein B0H16DRAFT_1730279 [Mycena metata]|uniref:Uncharacterized protein n=1 Tax=Mycena metata TaxID=1033252 RepID=A0AAD7I8J8_9AGAR|nr:hypothetical protein B0H16DRAFT_1730279 [Mycena metata]